MGHIILLGDSILDNGRYVPGQPDVVRQVRAILPENWSATLLAVDGATTRNVEAQLARLPEGASHLVVSAGGNDALGQSYILQASAQSVGEAVLMLGNAQDSFARAYGEMLQRVLRAGLPTALCTIYDTPDSAPGQPAIRTALSLFNDIITRAAFHLGLDLIDLRLICNEDADYANPIEPSARGGAKIAAAIAAWAAGTGVHRASNVIARTG